MERKKEEQSVRQKEAEHDSCLFKPAEPHAKILGKTFIDVSCAAPVMQCQIR